MVCFPFRVLLLVCGCHTSLGQTEKFEYECDILQRLDKVEKELKQTKEAQALSDATIISLKNELEETKAAQENTETRLTEALENQSKGTKDNANVGSTYVRWGRTTCPGNGTELVYSGVSGGSWWQYTGAPVDYLCMPKLPVYGDHYNDTRQYGGHVFGAEYDFYQRQDRMDFFPDLVDRTDLLDNDVPCAVCKTQRSAVLMVPAQNICMEGWTLEYTGLLVSGYSLHKAASEYICLDDQPEYILGGGANDNGKLLYFVEGRCGVLPCPPYVDGRELTCAVCTE